MKAKIYPDLCPFCQGLNSCQIQDKKPCWCNNTTIPVELIALVPSVLQDKSCICFSCINLFNENPAYFKTQYLQRISS